MTASTGKGQVLLLIMRLPFGFDQLDRPCPGTWPCWHFQPAFWLAEEPGSGHSDLGNSAHGPIFSRTHLRDLKRNMAEIANIPTGTIVASNGGKLTAESDSVSLTTDRRQWAYSACARFEIPGIEGFTRVVAVSLEVEAGTVGVGWLAADGRDWITRASAGPDLGLADVRLGIPVGTVGGALVFDNWTAGGESARCHIRKISILDLSDAEAEFGAAIAAEENGDTRSARLYYEAALRIDPSHVGAIAGLGRLRFVRPEQPLLDELKGRAPTDVCEVIIAVRNPCNYRCSYCVAAGNNAEPVKRFNFAAIDNKFSLIKSKMIVTSLECGGGEPTVHPEFADLLRLCAQYGVVSFPTNNSQNPRRWFPNGLGGRIEIRAALHPEGEEDLTRFLQYARHLIEDGCDFRCVFVAHPTRLVKIKFYIDRFAAEEVPFLAIPFIGRYNGQSYPYSYTEEQQKLLEYVKPGLVQKMRPDHAIKIGSHVNRVRNFRGIPCLAGYRHIYISEDGRMQRCLYDQRAIEGLLSAATPCEVKSCGCGLFLENLNFSQTPDFFDFFAEKAGFDALSLDWKEAAARRLGYQDAETGLAAEYMAMYDALMAAYGKDEFIE